MDELNSGPQAEQVGQLVGGGVPLLAGAQQQLVMATDGRLDRNHLNARAGVDVRSCQLLGIDGRSSSSFSSSAATISPVRAVSKSI